MKLVILGAAESGVGAAILAQQKGYEVFVTDNGPIKDKFKATLEEYNIEWEECGHTLERIMDADEVVKSPGIPDTVPVVRSFLEKGTPILSEIEFAGRYTDAKMLCITGSNGKTTVHIVFCSSSGHYNSAVFCGIANQSRSTLAV